MSRILWAMLLLIATSMARSQAPAEGTRAETPQNLPPTATDREENNPAKAAARVNEALKKEDATGDISVGTHADAVVVTGEVDSEAEAAKAKAAAEKAADGARVTTHIEVRDSPPTAAQAEAGRIAQRVEAGLKADSRTAPLGITVTVDGAGQVQLNGLVPTRESRRIAGEVAAKAAGSKPVRNHLALPAP